MGWTPACQQQWRAAGFVSPPAKEAPKQGSPARLSEEGPHEPEMFHHSKDIKTSKARITEHVTDQRQGYRGGRANWYVLWRTPTTTSSSGGLLECGAAQMDQAIAIYL